MADIIKFRCKGCEKKIAVRAEYAGKKAKCPGCKQPLRVPSPRPKRTATGSPIAAGADSSPGRISSSVSLAELAEMEANAEAEIRELSPKAATRPTGVRYEGGKDCPGCGSSAKPNAVICVHCGHNFESGKKLKTKKDSKVGKAFASVKEAATSETDSSGYDDGSGWSLWTIIIGGVFAGVGTAMAFWDFRPESDPNAEEAHVIEVALLAMYDTMGGMAAGAISMVIGLCLLAYGFRIFR